jgi:hypothetical protein
MTAVANALEGAGDGFRWVPVGERHTGAPYGRARLGGQQTETAVAVLADTTRTPASPPS